MPELKSGIYCIENIENGKKYIGKGMDVEKRMWDSHKECLVVRRAIKKYGDVIIRYVVEYCESGDLTYWEKYYIKEWNTKVPNGYNLTDGGEGMPGYSHTEEFKKAMSARVKGSKNPNYKKGGYSDKIKEGIAKNRRDYNGENNPNFGNVWSEESRKRASDLRTGIPLPEKTKQKMRGERPHTRGENSHWFNKTASEDFRNHRRLATTGEKNPRYGKKLKNKSSRYFGVYKIIDKKKYIYWKALITFEGKKTQIKTCKIEEDAARAYDKYVIENNLNRPLNFPEEYPNRR
jgi:group I intron endonuclease